MERERVCSLLDKNRNVIVVSHDGVKNKQLQDIRKALRGHATILMGSNEKLRHGIIIYAEKSDNRACLNILPSIQGQVGLVFTNRDPQFIIDEIKTHDVRAPALVGQIAPVDVVIGPGHRVVDPSWESFFKELNIPIEVKEGFIEILTHFELIKNGKRVGSREAALLNMLRIEPFSHGLVIKTIFDKNSVTATPLVDAPLSATRSSSHPSTSMDKSA